MTDRLLQHLRTLSWTLGLSLWLAHSTAASERTLVVTQLDGTRLSGELVDWNPTQLTILSAGQQTVIPAAKLLRIRPETEPTQNQPEGTFVDLVDGTRLPHHGFVVRDRQATITTSFAAEPLSIPTEKIRYVELIAAAPAANQLTADLAGDMLVIRNKKSGGFDQLSGLLGNVNEQQIEFTWDGESIPVKRTKVAAFAYFHTRPAPTIAPSCWLKLHSGALLPIQELSLEKQDLSIQTSSDLKFRLPCQTIREADYSQGKLVYLSDLPPLEQRWTPRIDLPASAELIQEHGLPRRDESYTGSSLTLRWPAEKPSRMEGELRVYEKGLALRSRTTLRYRLPTGMKRFIALAGMDPDTAEQGNVTLQIFADKQAVWQGEIDGSSPPTEINVGLGSARRLSILVDYGANLDFGDRLHLVEARLSK